MWAIPDIRSQLLLYNYHYYNSEYLSFLFLTPAVKLNFFQSTRVQLWSFLKPAVKWKKGIAQNLLCFKL